MNAPKATAHVRFRHATDRYNKRNNVNKTLLGLFTSFVGRREFALSVVETTCLEETFFKVVRACMRKTVE